MTPATMWTRLGWLLAAAALLVAVIPPEVVVVIARAVGLTASGALIWWYHRNADWKSSPIGRGTMAIKAGIFAIAAAANIRTVDTYSDLDLYALSHRSIAAAWLLLATALVFRLVVMRRIQAEGDRHIVTRLRPKDQP